MSKQKTATIGGAMVDSIAIIADDRIEHMEMRNAQSSFLLVESGRKVEAVEISQHCGGGAINSAIAMARLGADASTIVKLGQDDRAEIILRRLADAGVSTRWVMRDAASATGASVIISSHERDAAIFTYRGANTLLRNDDLKADMFAVDLVYVSSLSNESADCFPAIVAGAKAAGAKVVTNPGIRQLTSRTGPFQESLCDIDVLTLNRVEADALVPALVARFGEDTSALGDMDKGSGHELVRRGFASGGYELSLRGFMRAMTECGVSSVLVTNSAEGAYVASEGMIHFCPAAPAAVAGTAGAGDAFASTFSLMLFDTGDVATALAAASINAASVISHADTQTGLLKSSRNRSRTRRPRSPFRNGVLDDMNERRTAFFCRPISVNSAVGNHASRGESHAHLALRTLRTKQHAPKYDRSRSPRHGARCNNQNSCFSLRETSNVEAVDHSDNGETEDSSRHSPSPPRPFGNACKAKKRYNR